MTRNEMIIEGNLSLDKVSSSSYQEIFDEEWDYFFTEAQNIFFKQRYSKNNLYQKGFEESQKRRDDLRKITVTRFLKGTLGVDETSFSLEELYSDQECTNLTGEVYAFHLKNRAKTNGCKDWNSVDVIQIDDYPTVIKDPFNTPEASNPIAIFDDRGIVVTPVADFFEITCVRIPRDISDTQDCELAEHTHKEIVQYAVKLVIENIESPRIQTKDVNTE